jgi:hypothetical protein
MEALLGGKHVVTVAFLEALAEWARASGAGVGAGRLMPPPREADFPSRPAPYLRVAGDLIVPAGPGAGAWGGRAINDVFRGCDVTPDGPARLRTLRGVCVVRKEQAQGRMRSPQPTHLGAPAPPRRAAPLTPPALPLRLALFASLQIFEGYTMLAASLRVWVAAERARRSHAIMHHAGRKRVLSRARPGAPLASPFLTAPPATLAPSLALRSAGADVIECRPDPPAGGEGGAKKAAAKAKGGVAPAPAASAASAAAAAAAGDSERLSVSAWGAQGGSLRLSPMAARARAGERAAQRAACGKDSEG